VHRESAEHVSCCRKHCVPKWVPSSVENIERSPPEPWTAVALDRVAAHESRRCEGAIGMSLDATYDKCARDNAWMYPGTYALNGTYPCFAAAHGSTHVYLDITAPIDRIVLADVAIGALGLIGLACLGVLVATSPVVKPHFEKLLDRVAVALRAMENAWESSGRPDGANGPANGAAHGRGAAMPSAGNGTPDRWAQGDRASTGANGGKRPWYHPAMPRSLQSPARAKPAEMV
jgi:hypothetical protein